MGNMWVLYDPTQDTQSERLTTEEVQFAILRLKTKYINQFLIWRDDWAKWKKLNAYLDSAQSPFMTALGSGFSESLLLSKTNPVELKMSPAKTETIEQVRESFEFSAVHTEEVNLKDIFKSTQQQFNADQLSVNGESDFFQVEISPTEHLNFKNLNKQNAFGKRLPEDRYKIELLLINSNGKMFRTSARDISLSGTFTDKTLPGEFHSGVFDIVVINNMIKDDHLKRINLKGTCLITDSHFYVRFSYINEELKNSLRAGLDYYQRAQKKLSAS